MGAIADPVRREILSMLKRSGPRTAGAIAAAFDISRPGVSKHLRVLREHGLVWDEIRGRERVYRLDVGPLAPLHAWLNHLGSGWGSQLDALETEVYRTRRERRERQDAAPTELTSNPTKERTA